MNDGIDRRGFLKCMAWAGSGLVWTFAGGIPVSRAFGQPHHADKQSDFTFVQISDSHIGFNKPANTDVTATLQLALDKINACPTARISSSTPATSRTSRSPPSSTPSTRS